MILFMRCSFLFWTMFSLRLLKSAKETVQWGSTVADYNDISYVIRTESFFRNLWNSIFKINKKLIKNCLKYVA